MPGKQSVRQRDIGRLNNATTNQPGGSVRGSPMKRRVINQASPSMRNTTDSSKKHNQSTTFNNPEDLF